MLVPEGDDDFCSKLTYRCACAGNHSRGRLQPPDQAARDHEADRDQLRPSHDSAEDLAASGIVANEFQEIAGHAVENEIGGQHLSVELLALEKPHENEKIGQFDRGFEKLRRLKRYAQRSIGVRISDRIGKGHSPEMMGGLAIAASGGKTSHAPDGVSQGQAGREGVPGGKRGHTVPAHVPRSRHRRADQPSRENPSGLQRGPAEDVAGMGGVVAPIVDYVQDLGADDAAQDYQNAQVPGVVLIDSLLAGVANADPEADQDSRGNQQSVSGEEELADMKKLRKHY